mmetsp:Transcript_15955/g.20251  ORF Transcript_15955/g.20251 Transcript_15955/m.20251 type:complete len:304 (+) Transcript_15955:161-1072(+)|eukprot:CAMPEP_0203633542 /NCGR_PEP_ID=MMETSP0088-20131115/642_1 /ASSEMBLY_ACC=CAM_ASM_001087 /TAXON_ID=426623 /ORGANISM="Chaetoceros affinis, Strain CCMP159" /LENGTH=303 /DNA_ID=CAMNT_0050486887 /DNA_START=73 /DNA_END=984 /DNA_ORIENTATION=-
MPLSLDYTSVHTTLKNDVELVSALHLNGVGDDFPSSTYLDHVFRYTCSVIATITLTHMTILTILRSTAKILDIDKAKINQIAYQATNLTVNLVLGLYGIYHYTFTVPHMSTIPTTERITGFDQYVNFACLQIGYNIWSIPVGLFHVGESTTMLLHHVATICVSTMSTFSIFGFRYHQPFFFGLVEISSVPLAIMNYCKDNKQWAQTNIPTVATLARPIFAVMFLTSRVIMWTPNIYDILRNCFILLFTGPENLSYRVGMSVFITAILFLTSLQYYWGLLVLRGVIRLVAQVQFKKVKEVKKVE